MHLTLFVIYVKNNILKFTGFSCWWEWILVAQEAKFLLNKVPKSQSRVRVKHKTSSVLLSNSSAYDVCNLDVESSEFIFLLNLSAELLLYLAQPPVHGKTVGFPQSPVPEE